jgi:hypothetical protein
MRGVVLNTKGRASGPSPARRGALWVILSQFLKLPVELSRAFGVESPNSECGRWSHTSGLSLLFIAFRSLPYGQSERSVLVPTAMQKLAPTTKMLTGVLWLFVIACVGMAPSRLEASCGDYLNHKHFPSGLLLKDNGPADPFSKSHPTGQCEGGRCDRAPIPLPVDPISPRVTLREIASSGVSCFKALDLECEDWTELAQCIPAPVTLGGPLKPPIL